MATTFAAPVADPAPRSIWGGRALSGLVVLFLVMDGAIKLVPIRPVIDTLAALGWPSDAATARALGALLLGIATLYVHPRTAPLGRCC